jgi:hypothetical protein
MYPARSGSGLESQAMVSWAPNAKDVITSGNVMNEASKKKLNILVRVVQNCFFNVPPYLETTEC